MANQKQNIYSIRGELGGIAYRRLNCRLDSKGKVRFIGFSTIAQALHGGIIYFIDRRTCKKYLEKYCMDNPVKEIVINKNLTRKDLVKVGNGLYISKRTNYYKDWGALLNLPTAK